MRLKPDDLPDLELGESRNLLVTLGAAVGLNNISAFEITSPNLTFGTPIIDGVNVEVRLNADKVGTHAIIATATLDSGETVKGFVRARVVDSSKCGGGRYYD